MSGTARPAARKQRDLFVKPGVMRPASSSGKRKRPDTARSMQRIENSNNATVVADADPYDIMSFDGWTDPMDGGPTVRRMPLGERESAKKRAVGVKNEYPGSTRASKPSASSPPLPTAGNRSSRRDEDTNSVADARRSDQITRRQPEGKPVASTQTKPAETPPGKRRVSLASTDAPASRRRVSPDSKLVPPRKTRASPDSTHAPLGRRCASPDATDTRTPVSSKGPRSRRLIDALAEQEVESSEEELKDTEPLRTTRAKPVLTPVKDGTSESPSVGTDRVVKTPASVKFTYGAQRSILQRAGSGDPLGDSLLPPLPTSIPEAPTDMGFSFSPDESDDEEATHKGAIRSIHELRQAGANNRFADEIDDLLERVGTPTKGPLSLRRNALLEVAVKLHQKRFLRQFRDYDTNGRLFDDLAGEDDVISGFALVSALLTLLAANAAPRASRYLQPGLPRLLRKLLRLGDDIASIAGQRSMNISRSSRATITSLKKAMLKLGAWEIRVSSLSPRTLSLNFMRVAFGSPDGPACMEAFETLAGDLFSILWQVPQPGYLNECSEAEKADCSIVASVLQELSVGAVPSGQAREWTTDYPETISAALDATLQRRAWLTESFEASLLKLAMNCTNNNPPAASVWHQTSRLGNVAKSACTCFRSVKDGVLRGEWNADGYNRLLLVLGLMINLCEHAPSSKGSLKVDVLDDLIRAYLESYSSTTEADSVEKTQLNVAVGYLAIVLGFLSLTSPVRQRLENMGRIDGLERLGDSIAEFIAFYETVNSKEDAGVHVGRLQGLVKALKG